MLKSIALILICVPLLCNAQADQVDIGVSAGLYGKINTLSTTTMTDKNISVAKGMDVALKICGTEENTIQFLFNTGIWLTAGHLV